MFKVTLTAILILFSLESYAIEKELSSFTISLNGLWEMGSERNYTQKVFVPGIHTDPTLMNEGKLWYKKEVELPEGNWKYITLQLKGARFSPEVYINNVAVSKKNGGMASTFHLLDHADVKPGAKITIEIALTSLKDLPITDASYIPVADQWRSNISSCLWDDVELKFHGALRIDRIIPFIDFENKRADISFDISKIGKKNIKSVTGKIEIFDINGKLLIANEEKVNISYNKISILYGNILKPWSPEEPNLYKLKLSLISKSDTLDQTEMPFGIKDIRVQNKQFYLNGNPVHFYGGTVVWHRWMRDEEGRELGYNSDWFLENVIRRLKEHGANYLRFHLGVPPERLLDLCDKYGLVVQYEWNFFHGMPASSESLFEQYPNWLDASMRHPSIMLYHPYNETEGNQLEIVWDVLNSVLKDYPPLVMEERDVLHIHKYWWSLFENLGLYYDDADQFPKAIMVDEFGGNYLDGEGVMGGYPAIPETYLRFLGRNHTKESRLAFHAKSNAKVAEYWRRIGAAGVAPFCILGSWNDGNHWFLGNLEEGRPKPVWNALTCAWSPVSISLDIWDRNYVPGQKISVPLHLFNDTPKQNELIVSITIQDSMGNIVLKKQIISQAIKAFSHEIKNIDLELPFPPGRYTLNAKLDNPPEEVKYPIISSWEINVFKLKVPEELQEPDFAVASEEPEIIQFLKEQHIRHVPISDTSADIIIFSLSGWDQIAHGDQSLIGTIENAIDRGKSVILLDAGERYLGQGYPQDKNELGPLQGVAKKSNTPIKSYDLFSGISLSFQEVAEPESHIHPDIKNNSLWENIPYETTWMWNGMRGGLIVPATDMRIEGLSSISFLTLWKGRGADERKIIDEEYYSYELEGFYEFSNIPDDKETIRKLKNKIIFLVEDAPALANSLNPNAPIKVNNLTENYKESLNRKGNSMISLVNAGKNLTRVPVMMLQFGEGKGKLLVSQLLTSGRLVKRLETDDFYDIRYDVVANQFVLNMIKVTLSK